MKTKLQLLLFLFCLSIGSASAKFVQELQLVDGTILTGYIYRQVPDKLVVFYVDKAEKDIFQVYRKTGVNYEISWNNVKSIRPSDASDPIWFRDKITVADGTEYIGQVIEQIPGSTVKFCRDNTTDVIDIAYKDIKIIEKVQGDLDTHIYHDRLYTNVVKLSDGSTQKGLIVLRQYEPNPNDSFIDFLLPNGKTLQIYTVDIKEYFTIRE